MTITTTDTPWYGYHDNLVQLAEYLADHGASGDDVAYFIGKPWKYEDEWNECQAEWNEYKAQQV
jgi:hypothetical protein